jgi:hypothetical protein
MKCFSLVNHSNFKPFASVVLTISFFSFIKLLYASPVPVLQSSALGIL